MLNYLIRRIFTSILVLFGVSMLVFSVIHLVPGDVTMAILWRQKATEEKVAQLRQQLGLNDPLYVQYGRYLGNALRGDLGKSIPNNLPVSESIANQLPSTFALAMSALALALTIGGILCLLASLRHGSWFDTRSSWDCLSAVFPCRHFGWDSTLQGDAVAPPGAMLCILLAAGAALAELLLAEFLPNRQLGLCAVTGLAIAGFAGALLLPRLLLPWLPNAALGAAAAGGFDHGDGLKRA